MRARAGHAGETPDLHDVAGPGLAVGVVEGLVALEVGPTVARAEVARRRLVKRRVRDEGAADRAPGVGRDQRAALRAAVVVHAGVRQRRVVQRVQLVVVSVERLEPDLHVHGIAAGVGDERLDDAVPALPVGVDLAEPQAPGVRPRRPVTHVGRLAVGEAVPGDDQLETAHAGRGEVGIEHLAGSALLEGEPHVAAPGARRTEARLVRLGPGGSVAGTARRHSASRWGGGARLDHSESAEGDRHSGGPGKSAPEHALARTPDSTRETPRVGDAARPGRSEERRARPRSCHVSVRRLDSWVRRSRDER